MIPTDSEFMFMYFSYLGTFLYFLWRFYSTRKKKFKLNLIIFSIYTALLVYVFSDEENFKYGNSLAVLFYGGMFLLTHVLVYLSIEWIKNILKKED